MTVLDRLDVLENIMTHHKLYDEFEEETSRIKQKRQDFADPAVYVFVFGKGKFGKSSLINQLLGRNVAKTSIVPMTWRIDFFRPLSEEEARAAGGEFAEIRRAKSSMRERVGIVEAQRLCDEQERDVLKHRRKREREMKQGWVDERLSDIVATPSAELAVENQIIEVNWHYRNLALPASTVLVDTPGLFQDRGASRSQTQVLSSTDGVVFESPDAAYEYYYARADIVLWLFRADLLKDRDTRDALRELSAQRKRILGIVTHLDALSSSQQQQEAMQQLQQEYGDYVEGFLPAITGGESPNVGYGIANVRTQVERLGPMAIRLKQEAMQRFIGYIAQCCEQWLTTKGTALTGNITKLAVYCNLTSEALLKEVKNCHSMLERTLQQEVMLRKMRPDFASLIKTILCDEIPRQPEFGQAREKDATAQAALQAYYQQRISEEMRLDYLHKDAQERLQVATQKILAAGRQAAAGRRLEQVILRSGGRTEKRPLVSIIRPPDVSNLVVMLPSIHIPLVSVSVGDLVGDMALELFGDTFVGKALRGWGLQSSEEKRAPVLLKAQAATVNAIDTLPSQIKMLLTRFTKDAAAAIIDGADEAIGLVYKKHNLSTLKAEASILDRHLKALREIRAQYVPSKAADGQATEELTFSFETLFTLWSPRDNARTAVIQMFCEWFQREQDHHQFVALKWYRNNEIEAPDYAVVLQCCASFLLETKQQDGMTKWAVISTIRSVQWQDKLSDDVAERVQNLKHNIRYICLWEDGINFLGVDFEHFQLQGIASDFSCHLAARFAANFQREIDQQTFRISADELTEEFDVNAQVLNARTLGSAGGLGLMSGVLGNNLLPHAWDIVQHLIPDLGVTMLAGLTVMRGAYQYQTLLTRKRRRRQLLERLTAHIQSEVVRVADEAFTAATFELTHEVARQVIGSRTLVKKRALDYAAEGQFLDSH
jgi:hypothetical protein